MRLYTKLCIEAARRMERTLILNYPFEEVIPYYDSANTFFYCDPPYVGFEKHYQAGGIFGPASHRALFELLSRIKGKFLLSYNDCEWVRETYADYHIKSVTARYTLSPTNQCGKKEVLISNYTLPILAENHKGE